MSGGDRIRIVSALFAGIVAFAPVQAVLPADAATYRENVLWSFGSGADGRTPAADLTLVNGILYGTTGGGGGMARCFYSGCGTVFSLDPKTDAERVLYRFCSQPNCADGANPAGDVIHADGVTAGGTLYGTAAFGGTGAGGLGGGTLFALDPTTGKEKVLYTFCSLTDCADGDDPWSGVIDVRGLLYGVAGGGGVGEGGGTVFAWDPDTGAETLLYSFCSQENCTDGAGPTALIDTNGTLYGATIAGGSFDCQDSGQGCGTVFSLDPNTGMETVLHSFGNGADGANPFAGVIDVNNSIYGTTHAGGIVGCYAKLGCGTVFSLDLSTDTETVLYSFCSQENCTDGANPYSGLIDVDGVLYGTTGTGGVAGCGGYGCGTVFSLDPGTGTETVLYAFCSRTNCTDGAEPLAGLIAVDGKLYGTTAGGGTYGYGTVFVLKQKS